MTPLEQRLYELKRQGITFLSHPHIARGAQSGAPLRTISRGIVDSAWRTTLRSVFSDENSIIWSSRRASTFRSRRTGDRGGSPGDSMSCCARRSECLVRKMDRQSK